MSNIDKTIAEIESEMATAKARIDEIAASVAPVQADLDKLVEQEQALRAKIAAKVAERDAVRGDPQEWLALKRRYGVLASTRMQLRALGNS